MDFSRKTVVITGVSKGIGYAVAQRFIDLGANVAGIDLKDCELPLAFFLKGDVGDKDTLEAFASRCIHKFGRIDVLINNAMLSRGGVSSCSYEDFIYAQKVGVAAPYYLTKLLMDHFAKSAAVVNISSTRAFQSQGDTESYSAAKGGITALTHALAISLAGRVRVNAVAPGWIDIGDNTLSAADHAQHPAGRVGRPEDIVSAVLFFCAEENSFITGQTLVVDGGMSKLMVYHGDERWAMKEG